ncbi:MAG: organomercurial transporter MerC [Burkholderiales bacterium]
MTFFSRFADKAGVLGSIVTAMGCAACFPAFASLGAVVGLGFLNRYEHFLVSTLLPFFAAVVLFANAYGWFAYRQWHRTLAGMAGPAIVLMDILLFRGHSWTAGLLYVGLGLMAAVSIWDVFAPAHRACGRGKCEMSLEQT